jgi:hypothetical protein
MFVAVADLGGGNDTIDFENETALPEGWLGRRVVARGDLLYIIVKPGESEASVTDGR